MPRQTRNKVYEELAVDFKSKMEEFQRKLDSVSSSHSSEPNDFSSPPKIETLKLEFQQFQTDMMSKIALMQQEPKNSLDDVSQRKLNQNILIYGLQENTDEDLFSVVAALFKNKLRIDVSKNEINCCYRFGKKSATEKQGRSSPVENSKCRPVVVEFVCLWKRDEIFASKSKLKNSKIIFVEMSIKEKLDLFKVVRQKYKNACWTIKGNIKVYINNKIIQVDGLVQFNKLR